MDATPRNEKTVKPGRQMIVQLGPLRLVGPTAVGFLQFILAAIAGSLVYFRPSPRALWISGALWIAFIVYWGSAARTAAPTQVSETPASRRVHTRQAHRCLRELGFVGESQ